MSKKYGDVFCLRVLDQVVVVLCSFSAIKDLLEKRGEAYADRPPMPIMEITEMDWMLPNARKGELWHEGRKLLDRSLRPSATMSYRQMMQENTHRFLAQLLATPKNFRNHVELLQGRLVMSLTYGYDLKEGDDMIAAPTQAGEIMVQLLLPGAAMVNHIPCLKYIPSWVPWFSYEPLARTVRRLSEKTINDPINFVKNAMREGTAVRSLASGLLQEVEVLTGSERQKKEKVVKMTLGSIFAAGSDTTVSSLSSFFLALVVFPEVQKRAQAELDAVVERDRLPTFDDRSRLPYIEAICRELLRWQMVVALGVPHASTEDDVYRGFFIPKGSVLVANAWAVLHNPEVYPDPDEFRPERFLEKDGSFREDPAIALAFGAGKRICPGRHFVGATLFIVASSVLSVFNVSRAKDENGHEIPVRAAISARNGLVAHPEEFQCSITPRDQVAKDLILANSLS